MPWPGTAGLGLLGASALAAELTPAARGERFWKWGMIVAWVCTLVVPVSLFLEKDEGFTFDGYVNAYYAVLAWLIAAVILPTSNRTVSPALQARWRVPAMILAFFGGFLWLTSSYSQNLPAAFHIGLLINLILLILYRCWFRMPAFAIQGVNTLILLLAGLPLVDLFIRPPYRLDAHPDPAKKYYSYENAKRNPGGFASWQAHSLQQWVLLENNLYRSDPAGVLPWRLKPNSHTLLFQSRISINSKGFRGQDIHEEKGKAYRIVALGESTTFGITLNAEDKPWPELLEQMIRERLKPGRPVEVINAGVPSYDLKHNLYRLPTDILPLKPDMIISYHGYNGFHLIEKALPLSYVKAPPMFEERPLRLLANCEYRMKLICFKQLLTAKLFLHPPSFSNPLETAYAQTYRQLMQLAQTNGIRLVLANYSMAVNDRSDPDVIEFYRAVFPAVHWQIKANAVHSMIVQGLAQEHPEVCFVDTHPHLDGEHQKFIDLCHFTQEGDRQLAETFFAGIKQALETDWSRPDSGSARQ